MWYVFWILIWLVGVPMSSSTQERSDKIPRLAIVPLHCPSDPDYGVFMSDRLAVAFMQHAFFPPQQRQRFQLVETNTLEPKLFDQLVSVQKVLPDSLHQVIWESISAHYVLVGWVETTGIHTIYLKLIDLNSGKVLWSEVVRDNLARYWISDAEQKLGDSVAEMVMNSLEYSAEESPLPHLPASKLPQKIILQPFHCIEYPEVASELNAAFRQHLQKNQHVRLLPEHLSDGATYSRSSLGLRKKAVGMGADALLFGSVLALGKDGKVSAVGVALRLVDVPSGKVLWSTFVDGRLLWRWDKLSDILETVAVSLSTDLNGFLGHASDLSALLNEASDGESWVNVGQLCLERHLFDEAKDAFQKALAFTNTKALAHNGLGNVYVREMDMQEEAIEQFKQALVNAPDYIDAHIGLASIYVQKNMAEGISYARKAIQIDSTNAIPYRLLGQWHDFIGDDLGAVGFYKKYIAMKPNDLDAIERLGACLIRLRNFDRVDELIAPLIDAQPEAIDLLPIVARSAFWNQSFDLAHKFYARYLQQINSEERLLYTDIAPILSHQEAQTYRGLVDTEKRVFERRFWRKKDPNVNDDYNARLLEHYGRVWFARKNFSKDAAPWDHRGDAYVRYGRPEFLSRSGQAVSDMPLDVQQVKSKNYKMLYSNLREEELIKPLFAVGDVDSAENRHSERNAWESWVYVGLNGGCVLDFEKMADGYRFAEMSNNMSSRLKSGINVSAYASSKIYEEIVSLQSDQYTAPRLPHLADIHIGFTRFRAEANVSRLDVTYGLPLSSLIMKDGKVRIERAIALIDSNYDHAYKQKSVLSVEVAEPEVIDVMRMDVPAGYYHATVSIKDLNSGKSALLHQDLEIDSFDRQKVHLSDLLLSKNIEDYDGQLRFRRGNLSVLPQPSFRFGTADSLKFYFEIYNLTRDEFNKTRYKISYKIKSVVDRPNPDEPFKNLGQPDVYQSVERTGEDTWERSHLEVHLGKVRSGQNRLLVSVIDLVNNTTAEKETVFFYQSK